MRVRALGVCALLLISSITFGATYKTLHSFSADRSESYWPYSGVIFDPAGNLVGVAAYAGADYTDGAIFQLTPSQNGWNFVERYEFEIGNPAGQEPIGGLAIDEAGNLYGTTTFTDGGWGCGSIFQMSPENSVTVLHYFQGADGCTPQANLRYSNGLLWGTTSDGGPANQGTVFSISTSGDPISTYSFKATQGAVPLGGFNVWNYGTTTSGGRNGAGNVYRVDPVKGLVGKHNFRFDGQAGFSPMGDLLTMNIGGVRTMFGTTSAGGLGGGGVVYQLTEIAPNSDNWRLRTLHSFFGLDGKNPLAGLSADSAGNLYGTASQGGAWGCGVVFKLSPAPNNRWKYSVVYSFNDTGENWDGCYPSSGVAINSAGHLYGTTLNGGDEYLGTVYEIIP